jgi:HK97 family phage portal protein
MTLVPTRETGLGTYESPRARVLEQRDPSAATKPVVYQTPGHPMPVRWDAHNALQWGYYANTFVYRCVQCKAEDISGLPFRVGADPDKPNDYDAKNPLARLLSPPPYGPNRNTSARQLWGWTIAQYLVTGRWAWEQELGARDVPVALWPLPAPYLKPVPSEGGGQYFSKFQFGRSGEEKTLMADRVFYHWKPSQSDWRQPESVLDAARLDVSVAVMQDRYDYAFLSNDSRPAAIIVYEGFETPAEDEAFKRQFRSEFRGPDNAGRAAFVEADRDTGIAGALDVKTLGLSAKDSQAIQRYDAKLRAICVAFGVPLTRLGDASGRTFANADQETHVYWTGLLPLLADIADAVNIKLAPLFGQNVGWFDISKVEALRPANKFTGPEALQGYDGGLITKNEARAELGLPPILDGDTFKENAPAPDIVLPVSTSVPRGLESPAVPPYFRGRAQGTVPALYAPPTADHRAEKRARAVAHSTVQINALEQTWTRTFRKLFTRQAAEVLQRLEGKRGRQATRATGEPDQVFRKKHWQDVTAAEAEGLVLAVFAAGAGRVAGEFGVSFDLQAAYVQEFVKSRANNLAGQVTDTTYGQITDALADGVTEGETIQEIAQRVKAVFDNADTGRAVTIARTEVISAYNASGSTVAAQLGADVVGGQQWITTEDTRTRPEHARADEEVVAIGEPFVNTGEPLAYPGDPSGSPWNIINCRCVVAFLTPQEMDERAKRVETRAALALLGMVRPGTEIDELALRRSLREVRAA